MRRYPGVGLASSRRWRPASQALGRRAARQARRRTAAPAAGGVGSGRLPGRYSRRAGHDHRSRGRGRGAPRSHDPCPHCYRWRDGEGRCAMTAPNKREKRFPKIKGRDYFGVFPQWREPDDWRQVPFSHTITQTTCYGIPHFNPGTSLYLVEDRAPLRGEIFIWCRKSFDGFPTAPVWGRFIGTTPKGDKVLTTMGAVVVVPLGPRPLPTTTDYARRVRN